LLLLVVVSRVLAHLAYLLLLHVVLTHVLAQLGLCVHCVFTQCWMIVPNSSLHYWHPFAVDKEPSSLVYNRNEDSFNSVHNNSLSSKKHLYCIYVINSQSDVSTVKSTNECVVIIKKYLYCIYVIMYSKN
jgi:hypothetical protein